MKKSVSALLVLALTACGNEASRPVDDFSDREPDKVTHAEIPAPDRVRLSGRGLTAGAEAFFFNAGKAEVEASLASALGEKIDSASNEECGAGSMDFTTYPGQLTVNFQDGKLAGWFLHEDDPEERDIATAEGIGFGSSEADLAKAMDWERIEGSTLGDEFTMQDGVSGFLDSDGKVSSLFAGTQCFFR